MKKLLSLLLTFATVLCITACGAPTNNPSQSSSVSEKKPAQLNSLLLAGGPANGGWFAAATAICDRTNAHFDNFPFTATTGGAAGNPLTISIGEADAGMSLGIFLNLAKEGKGIYEKPITNLRAVAGLESQVLYFITDASLGYKTMDDAVAAGAKVKIGSLDTSAASYHVQQIIAEAYGLKGLSDLQENGKMYIADGSALFDSYSDKHFNFISTMKACPDASISDLLNNRKSNILSLSQNVIDSLVEKYNWADIVIPAGTYPGQEEDVHTVGIKNILVVRDDLPEEASYYLAKTLYEDKQYFDTVQASWKKFKREDMVVGIPLDWAEGALKYWKEIGLVK